VPITVNIKESAQTRSYVPVYTLHDMKLETEQAPQVPVIVCTGCGHDIPAPNGGAAIQCRDCGKKMQIVSIRPAAQTNRAT
jgi:predicted RNA-binding Zn-ribbon protein involved in translation (DUF1610 family)